MRRAPSVLLALALALGPVPAAAQLADDFTLKQKDEDYQRSHQRWVINGRIILAKQRFLEAIRILDAQRGVEDTQRAALVANNGYKLLRAAHGGVDHALKTSKFPDPLLPLLVKRLQQARATYVAAEMQLDGGTTDARRIAAGRHLLEEAVRRTQEIIDGYVF